MPDVKMELTDTVTKRHHPVKLLCQMKWITVFYMVLFSSQTVMKCFVILAISSVDLNHQRISRLEVAL